jgi:hypothetical protein
MEKMTPRVMEHLKRLKAATRRGTVLSLRLEEYVLKHLFHVAIEWMRVPIVETMENETTARITNQLKAAAMENETTARLMEHVEAAARRIDGRYLRWEQQLPMVLFFALILLALLLLVLIIQIKGLSIVGILSTMYLASLLSRYVSHVM